MSRRNNVRGPTSALTEFLRESGITPTTVARRARTREVPQPVAGPSGATRDGAGDSDHGDSNNNNRFDDEYASDKLDDSEQDQPTMKKHKLSRAAEVKLKAKAKAGKGKGKAKVKKSDDDDDYKASDGDEDDAYTALSKMWKDNSKPAVGSFEECARCKKQFTVTKYTLTVQPPPGYLCHICAKASGADPFKKPTAPRKRKMPTDKRIVVHFEERRFPSLASLCIQLISGHIDDVEALGDIGGINMDELSKSLARNRSLNAANVQLFYNAANTKLTLYDSTNLIPSAFCTMASLNPRLTTLRLDYCGRMDSSVIETWSSALPNLKHLELLGPFLVRTPAWLTFIKSHSQLESFLITQSPRFDLECVKALVDNCKSLLKLRLKEIGKMSDDFLECIRRFKGLTYLDLSYPGVPEALSEEALIKLMDSIAGGLTYLDLSNNVNITDAFLLEGLKPYAKRLSALILASTPELTDDGVAELFGTWKSNSNSNPPLTCLDMSRDHELGSKALESLLKHSGKTLRHLNINGWRTVTQTALKQVALNCSALVQVDLSWCREVDDWVIQDLMENCKMMRDLKVWGCQRITINCPRRRNVTIQGIASI